MALFLILLASALADPARGPRPAAGTTVRLAIHENGVISPTGAAAEIASPALVVRHGTPAAGFVAAVVWPGIPDVVRDVVEGDLHPDTLPSGTDRAMVFVGVTASPFQSTRAASSLSVHAGPVIGNLGTERHPAPGVGFAIGVGVDLVTIELRR